MPLGDAPLVNPSLVNAVATISPERAAALARRHFGVSSVAQTLRGERDENFLIRSESAAFVLKIANPAEDRSVTDFHTKALVHVASADATIPVPRLAPAVDGRFEAEIVGPDGQARVMRLLTFLSGTMAARTPQRSAYRLALGEMTARFDCALRDFTHPAAGHDLSWDLKHTPRLRNLLSGVRSLEARADIERALDRFAEFVAPALPDLRAQVIHNDLNPYNVLVGEADFAMIVGLLDFGDMVRAPLVNEVAIAAAYHVSPGADPLAPILEIVGAYNTITPLTAWECDLIFDLIATRLAMTVLITEWRASRYPENSAYIMKNHPAAAAGLKRLGGVSPDQAQDRLRRRCGVEA